jgi:protein-disulfide isomerase
MRTLVVTITVLVITALVVGVVIVVQNARRDIAAAAAGPAGLSDKGGHIVGPESATVTVTIYADYLCPNCKTFEDENMAQLDQYVKDGKVKLEFVPVSILDRLSNGTEFSTRAASSAYCVIESDPDLFQAYNTTLFANQPAENSDGLPTAQLAQIAQTTGVSQAGQDCITAEKYKGFVTKNTDDASKDGMGGTPYVLVNGEQVKEWSAENMKAAIDKALAG